MRPPIVSRAQRTAVSGALVLLLLATTATHAHACLILCAQTFGVLRTVEGDLYELEYCTQRYNSAGGFTTTCYYSPA